MSTMNAAELRKVIARIEDLVGQCSAHENTDDLSFALDEALEEAEHQLGLIEAGADE